MNDDMDDMADDFADAYADPDGFISDEICDGDGTIGTVFRLSWQSHEPFMDWVVREPGTNQFADQMYEWPLVVINYAAALADANHPRPSQWDDNGMYVVPAGDIIAAQLIATWYDQTIARMTGALRGEF